MARTRWKFAEHLRRGDRVVVRRPSCTAVVNNALQARKERVRPYGKPDAAPELAIIISYKMIDGPFAGDENYVYQHPGDKVMIR